MSQQSFAFDAFGEIPIRCINLDAMGAFYGEIIRREPINDPDNDRIVFLSISEGFVSL